MTTANDSRCAWCRGSVIYDGEDYSCLSCSRVQTPGMAMPIDMNVVTRVIEGGLIGATGSRCRGCDGPVGRRNRSSLCADCYQREREGARL